MGEVLRFEVCSNDETSRTEKKFIADVLSNSIEQDELVCFFDIGRFNLSFNNKVVSK